MSSKHTIEVKPIPLNKDEFHETELSMFQFPSLICGIGSVRSGKTTTMIRLVEQFKPIFGDNVILFSPTFKNDVYSKYTEDKELFLETFDEVNNEILQKVLNIIKDDEEVKKHNERYLLVFDDIVGLLPNFHLSKDHKWWSNFITTYRHGGQKEGVEGSISIIILTQYYKDLSPVLRLNCSYYMFLGAHSNKQLKYYAEELSATTDGDDKLWIDLYHKIKDGNSYNIMTLDMRKLRVLKNFNEIVYQMDKEKSDSEESDIEESNSENEEK